MSVSPAHARNILATFGVGIIVLCYGVWLFVDSAVFLSNATTVKALIVDVTYEVVPKGRGSAMAYVPTIELTDASRSPVQVKVDTYNEDPVYTVGTELSVLCNLTRAPATCVETSVFEYLAPPIVALLFGLGFLSVGIYLRKLAANGRTISVIPPPA